MTGMRTAMGTAAGGGGGMAGFGAVRDGQATNQIYGLIRDGKHHEAIAILTAKQLEFPSSRAALSLLAFCYYYVSDFQSALQHYERLMKMCPDVDEYRLHYAQSLFKAGLYEPALKACQAVADSPGLAQRVRRAVAQRAEHHVGRASVERRLQLRRAVGAIGARRDAQRRVVRKRDARTRHVGLRRTRGARRTSGDGHLHVDGAHAEGCVEAADGDGSARKRVYQREVAHLEPHGACGRGAGEEARGGGAFAPAVTTSFPSRFCRVSQEPKASSCGRLFICSCSRAKAEGLVPDLLRKSVMRAALASSSGKVASASACPALACSPPTARA